MLGQSPLTRAHCGGGGARSLDRARGVWRLRLRWRRRAVTSPVTRVTRAAHHARVCVRHHRASRASSPFSAPPAHDRHARAAAAAALARSLARARGGGGGGVGGGVQLHRASCASRASRARACTSPPRIARVITVPLPPTRPHARAATAAALARSIARAVCGGCGGGGGRWRWRAVTSPVTRVTRADRHARVRVRHHFASRASSPFSVSPRTTGTRALLRRRRSLARSRARRRRRWGWGWRSVTPRVTCGTRVTRVTRAREHVITAHRARHHRSSPPHAPTRARCDGSGARSLDSARGVWRLRWRRWRAVEVAGGYIARHARYARRASRACTRTSSPRIARVITVFRPPRARPARARCCGGGAALARSLARAEAEAVGLGVAFSYTARHARHARARARHHRASRASSPPPFPDVTHAHARQRRRRCLVCSLARARGGGGGRSFARRACLARHARARARHPRHGTC